MKSFILPAPGVLAFSCAVSLMPLRYSTATAIRRTQADGVASILPPMFRLRNASSAFYHDLTWLSCSPVSAWMALHDNWHFDGAPVDEVSDLDEVRLDHAAGRHGGAADADTARHHGALVARHAVLVQRHVDLDADHKRHKFGSVSSWTLVPEVDTSVQRNHEQMVQAWAGYGLILTLYKMSDRSPDNSPHPWADEGRPYADEADLIEQLLDAGAVDAGRVQVQQDQVVVRAAGDDGVAQLHQSAGVARGASELADHRPHSLHHDHHGH